MSGSGTRPQVGMVLPTQTTEEVRADRADVAVLPVGSFEQHGAFLPLATDTVIACTIAGEIAAAYPVLQLPPVTISCSHEHAAWPGTISLSAATLYAVVRDITDSLRRSGIRGLILVNGHGGNYVLRNIVQESAGGDFGMALFPGSADWDAARTRAGVRTPSNSDMHAGELETSILLHAHPELVRSGHETSDWISDERKHLLTLGMSAYTESGVIGRPSRASADKGKEVLAGLVDSFAEYLSLVGAEKEAR